MAGAGCLCESPCVDRMERGGRAGGGYECCGPCTARKIFEPASERERHIGFRRGGAGPDRSAYPGAAACAGLAGNGDLDWHIGRGCRQARCAILLRATIDGAVGEPAWWLRLWPDDDCADCARCGT